METKICSVCRIEKTLDCFHKGKTKSGYQYKCKECKKIYSQENKEKENLRKLKWKENNREKIKESKKKYFQKNKEFEIKKNIERVKVRKKSNPVIKLTYNMRSRLYYFIKESNITNKNKTFEVVGCSPEELKIYLEKKFRSGMCWDNYGLWHVDHIIPLSSAKTERQLYDLCHYSNLQPLWASENISKGSKIFN